MTREIYMAFCFSVAFHTAMVGFCPAPRLNASGNRGNSRDIVVLGVIELAPTEPEISKAVKEIKKSEGPPKPPQPESVDDSEPLPEEKIAMVQPEKATPSYERPAKHDEPPQHEAPSPAEKVIPGKQAQTQGQIQDIRSRYLSEVVRKLEYAKKYPLQAYLRGIEGTIEVEFTISLDGNASAIKTRKFSQYDVFDNAAKEMVSRASPFNPLPRELGLRELRIVVPLVFRIDEAREQ